MSPFGAWLLAQYGKADTPTGDLAREFARYLADSDDRARVRQSLEYYVGPEGWALDQLDLTWAEYTSCTATSVPRHPAPRST